MTKKNILVIGGGISGMTTAVEAAEVGHNVTLVEKLPYLGGRVIRMNQYFPKLCPPYCGLEINFRRIKQNPRIKIYTSTTIETITGSVGDFSIQLKSQATFVNDNCTACGECEKVCPEERPNQFNYGLDKTKAIYLPHELAFPFKYTIDDAYCTKENCKKCQEVCKYDAINFSIEAKSFTVNADTIVIATGWQPYDASKLENLNFNQFPNIITNVQMERLAAVNGPGKGKILRPSDNIMPKNFAFVQCAGSRDEKHLAYCSAVCCSASLKQALNIREQIPESTIKIFYIDLRVSGRNEDMLIKVKADKNIELIKGKVSRISEDPLTKELMIEAEDIMSGKKSKEKAELIILATGMQASASNLNIVKYNEYGFINEDGQEDGIFSASCSKKPMDVSSSNKDACGMALKAIQENEIMRY
ncbi:MAG: FAD-dependent oxidoreductase [Bacteroidales bacterium]|nr:FAD-dependent oxidoreductase [Bacteroidales bacterium]